MIPQTVSLYGGGKNDESPRSHRGVPASGWNDGGGDYHLEAITADRLPFPDGTVGPPPAPGERYGPEWQEAMFRAEDILQRSPMYGFLTRVAGATNGRVEDIVNMDTVHRVVALANESGRKATRILKHLREKWDLFEELDSVMGDFDLRFDAGGPAFVLEILENTLEVFTLRRAEYMLGSRIVGYSDILVDFLTPEGIIQTGAPRSNRQDFHFHAGRLIDAIHWALEPLHRSDIFAKADDDRGRLNFLEIHRRTLEYVGPNQFSALVLYRALRERDPSLVSTLLEVVLSGPTAHSRTADYYRGLSATTTNDVAISRMTSNRVDPLFLLVVVLDMSWQVVDILPDRKGVLRTKIDSNNGVVIIIEEVDDDDDDDDDDDANEEVNLTPKEVWYLWVTRVLRRLMVARRDARPPILNLSDWIFNTIIRIERQGESSSTSPPSPAIDNDDDDDDDDYSFHNLFQVAKKYSDVMRGGDTTIDTQALENVSIRIDEINLKFMAPDYETLSRELQQFMDWIDEQRQRARVFYDVTVSVRSATRNLIALLENRDPPQSVSPGFESEGGSSIEGHFDYYARENGARPRLIGATATVVDTGGEWGAPRLGQHFVGAGAENMDRIIGGLYRLIDAYRRVRNLHAELREEMEVLLRGSIRGKRGGSRNAQEVDPEWILRPRFTGRISMSPPLVMGIESAISEIRRSLPGLAPNSVRDARLLHRALATTPVLGTLYARVVAAHMLLTSVVAPRQLHLDRTYDRIHIQRVQAIQQMSSWVWGTPPRDTGRQNASARKRNAGKLRWRHRVETLPPPLHPTDVRFKRRMQEIAVPGATGIGSSSTINDSALLEPKRPRLGERDARGAGSALLPSSARIGGGGTVTRLSDESTCALSSSSSQGRGRGDPVLATARHIVDNWDEDVIRDTLCDHIGRSDSLFDMGDFASTIIT
jgi:hypothetical protein